MRKAGTKDSKPRVRRTKAQILADKEASKKSMVSKETVAKTMHTTTESAVEYNKEMVQPIQNKVNAQDKFFQDLQEFKAVKNSEVATTENTQQATVQNSSEVKQDPTHEQKRSQITGFMLLFVIDALIPRILAFVYPKLKKGKTVTVKSLKLDDDEREEMMPMADEVAKELQLNVSPITIFSIHMLIIYGFKLDANE